MSRLKSGPFAFIIQFAVLLFIFGIFPAFVTMVASNYKHKAETIIDHKDAEANSTASVSNSVMLANAGNMSVLTEEQAFTIRKIKSHIIGKWTSLQDRNYTVEFLKNGSFTDKDSDSVVAYGTWGSIVSATSSSYSAARGTGGQKIEGIGDGKNFYYLVKTQAGEKYKNQDFLYEIMQLDSNKAILYYTGNGKMLYFERSGPEVPVQAPSPVSSSTASSSSKILKKLNKV